MARLFTVVITECVAHRLTVGDDSVFTFYETDFAGIHFSRTDERDVMYWVRVAARKRYGKNSQVIFLHRTEGI